MKRSLRVEVAGQKFSLQTEADPEYVESLASFVTQKVEEARNGAKAVATQSLVILAALHIADELFELRRKEDDFRRRVREKSQHILVLLDEGSECAE